MLTNELSNTRESEYEVTLGWMVPHLAKMKITATSQREAGAIEAQMISDKAFDVMQLDWVAGYDVAGATTVIRQT
jgi:hypothetical protein